MTAREELVARIAELSEAIATTGQMVPKDFVMESELTLPQIMILYMLASGPEKISDIARVQGMARSNASSMVERLVRKGLVERVSDPNDRRVALASLTNKGRKVVETANRSNYVAMEKVAAILTIDELELVAHALEILDRGVKGLEASNGDAVAVRRADGRREEHGVLDRQNK